MRRLLKMRLLKIYSLIFLALLIPVNSSYAEILTAISGRVFAEDTGEGIPGVIVTARSIEIQGKKYYHALTDGKGMYIFNDMKPGGYLLGFSAENSNYVSVEPHLEVNLPTGKNVVNANFVLQLGGSVSGTIYLKDGVTPASDIMVAAEAVDSLPEWTNKSTMQFTGEDGIYFFQGLPITENCFVHVRVKGRPFLKKAVQLKKGEHIGGINFTLTWDESTGISGYAKASSGIAVPDDLWIIILVTDSSGNEVAQASTDETGNYSIKGLEPGIYRVSAFWPNFPPKEGDRLEKTAILVEEGKFTEVNFEFDKY